MRIRKRRHHSDLWASLHDIILAVVEATFDVLRLAVVDFLHLCTDLTELCHEIAHESRVGGEAGLAVGNAELTRVMHRVTVEQAGASEAVEVLTI